MSPETNEIASDYEPIRQHTRRLRRDSTKPEQLLWSVLRNRGLFGLKFRRQHPVEGYVVDFYCHDRQLVVELDGESHEGRESYDKSRQGELERFGFRVFRGTKDDVLTNLEGVALGIAKAAGIEMR